MKTLPQNDRLPSGFPSKILCEFLISPMAAIFPANILLDLISLMIFSEDYEIQSSLLCILLHILLRKGFQNNLINAVN